MGVLVFPPWFSLSTPKAHQVRLAQSGKDFCPDPAMMSFPAASKVTMRQRRSFWSFRLIAVGLILVSVAQVQAGTVVVGSGAGVDTGQGQLLLGCNDLEVAGGLGGHASDARDVSIVSGGSLSTHQLSFSGDWDNPGQVEVSGPVRWQDGCNVLDAQMTGSTDFSALEISTTNARTVRLEANATQQVSDSLILQGAAGALLMLRSTVPGQQAGLTLAPGGSQSIAFLDVADMDSSGGQPMAPEGAGLLSSVDSGNNINWFHGVMSAVAIPTLGLMGTLLLIMLVALMGAGRAWHARLSNEGIT